MTGRLAELVDRPLDGHERHRLFALATAVILCAAALLLTLPSDPPPSRMVAVPHAAKAAVDANAGARKTGLSAEVRSAARRFLRSYLEVLYGRRPVGAIEAAKPRLRRRLVRARLRVPPAALRRHPRVTDLDVQRVRHGRFVATAEVDDGGPARYTIELTLTRWHGRWRVSEVTDH